MNKIVQVRDPLVFAERFALFHEFPGSAGLKETHIHELWVDSVHVGHVLTEVIGNAGGVHLHMYPEQINRGTLSAVTNILHEIVAPLMKALGMDVLITSCKITDKGTANFLRKAGFTIQEVVVATLPL